MSDRDEKSERALRAERLYAARKALFRGPKGACDAFGWNINNYKAHESGRNGFGIADAKAYARAFDVSVQWLNFGHGSQADKYVDLPDKQQEVIDLYQSLPDDLQDSYLEILRKLAANARTE